jgi:SAM-dependent methyltransferase
MSGHPVSAVFTEAYRVGSWSGALDGDDAVVDLCTGPTLDVGCGPGRMTRLLAERGTIVLGIDVVPEAVWRTRDRGAVAMLRDVFDRVPAEGRWGTVLLADGNLGIGGNPSRLLARLRHLLSPGGLVVADVAPPGTGLRAGTVQLRAGGLVSEPFPWAFVGADAVAEVARGGGFATTTRDIDGRWVAVMEADAA